MGKPDWQEKAARVNEYGEQRPLTDLLHNTQQLSEATGAALAQLSLAQPSMETKEERTKRLSAEITRKIRACTDTGELQDVQYNSTDDLAAVKEASQSAYDWIMGEYNKKLLDLGG